MPTLWEIANAEAVRQGVDPRLVAAVMHTESRGRANAVSPAGARGPMQLMPGTAKELGVDIDDPADNIRGGIKYLGQMLKRYGGDARLATAAYNAGPGAVDRSLQRRGDIPRIPETQNYVRQIAGLMGTPMPARQQEAPAVKHGIDIDPSWLEGGGEPAAKAPAAAARAVAKGPQQAAIDPRWLEDASAPAAAPKAATARAGAPTRPYTTDTGLPDSMGELGARLKGLLPLQTDPADGKLKMLSGPAGVVKGIASIPALLDRAGAKVGQFMGAKPQRGFADDLERAIDARTLAPANAVEAGIAKGGEFAGAGIAGGGVIGGAGRAAQLAGATRVGGALARAGAVTPGSIGASVTGGAAANAADELVGKNLESPTARTALNLTAGLLGGAPGASLGQRMAGGIRNAEAAATLATAREAGIPVQATDLSPALQQLKQRTVDKVPFGNLTAGRVPAQQVEAVQNELRAVAERYRPANLNPGAGTTGTDRYLAGNLRSGYAAAKADANAAYQHVEDVMKANPGLPPIKLGEAQSAAKELLDEFPDTFRDLTLSSSAQKAIGAIRSTEAKQLDSIKIGGVDIDLRNNPQLRAALEAQGVKTTTEKAVSLQEARALASELSQLANTASSGAAMRGGSQRQAGALKFLAQAVGKDVDGYMAQAPDDVRNAYQQADEVFKQRVLPYRADPKVYKLVSSKTPKSDVDTEAQGLFDNLFNSKQGERSAMALQLLDGQGKQAAAYQALRNTGEKALSNTGPTGLKAVQAMRSLDIEGNPALANIAQHYPEFAQEAQRLRGILQVGRNAAAQEGRNNAATGIQNMPLVTGGAMLAGGNAVGDLLGNAPMGYTLMIGAPVGAANALNLANRLGAGAVARGGANAAELTAPGAIQGLLAADYPEDEPPPKKSNKKKSK